MIYRLRHVTTYAYAHAVDLAAHLLLLTPRRLAYQQVSGVNLAIAPTPSASRYSIWSAESAP